MSRYEQIRRGKRARKNVTITIDGDEVQVGLRVLPSGYERVAMAAARAVATAEAKTEAESAGLSLADMPELKQGNPEYDLAVIAQVVLRAVVDIDSPENAPVPFFSSLAQVDEVDRDELVLAHEKIVAWQEECSPRRGKLTPQQYAVLILSLCEEDENGEAGGSLDANFIESLPRATLLQSLRFLVKGLRTAPTPSSPSTSPSSGSGDSASSREPTP